MLLDQCIEALACDLAKISMSGSTLLDFTKPGRTKLPTKTYLVQEPCRYMHLLLPRHLLTLKVSMANDFAALCEHDDKHALYE